VRPSLSVRARGPRDLPRLVEILAEQQPSSRYPFRWPLPFPAEQFIARDHELAAFVAEVNGEPAGHVCVQSVEGSAATNGIDGDQLALAWSGGHGRPPDELAAVLSLFTSLAARGSGAGGALLDAAVGWVREHGLAPYLDVVQRHSPALRIYEARGWQRVGEVRPPWLPNDEPPVIAMILPA
jgi:GNAT superfamily N-acetyltransferase